MRLDIRRQLQKPDGTLNTWVSCETQQLGLSTCPIESPQGDGQVAYDLSFLPDHALAVQTKVLPNSVFLPLVQRSRFQGGHRLNLRSIEDTGAPAIVYDSERWTYVDDDGFALPLLNQTGWSQVFRHRLDGPGNYGNSEQNGGRLWSTSTTIFQATLYPEAADDWKRLVSGTDNLASQLWSDGSGCSHPLSYNDPSLLRAPINSSLARGYCVRAYGKDSHLEDCWGTTPCDVYGSITWGLRDGPQEVAWNGVALEWDGQYLGRTCC